MASPLPRQRVLSFEDARHLVEQHASGLRPTDTETTGLLDLIGRVLAKPVFADRDFPPFRRSTRDGYAIRAADLVKLPATLSIIGEIKAGGSANFPPLTSGQAAAIMTGAAAPDGSDAVVMVEYTVAKNNIVEITRAVVEGENIVPAGAEAKRGDHLLVAGTRVDHRAIALAASVGESQFHVYKKPQVAILATGDEIVGIGDAPGPFEIRNSNSYSLAAQVRAVGGDPVVLPVAPDEPGRLRELIAEGFNADLLLLSGGVSMGKYDLVEQVLAEFNAEFFFTGAQIQPGRPVVFGKSKSRSKSKDKYFFGLPGNPVSTMVTFELFVRPVLDALARQSPQKLVFLHAKLKSDIKTKTGLTRFLPAILSGEFDQTEVEVVPWQGSGDIAATARSNCYIVIPPDRERIAAGEWIAVLMR
jgi:molybdopterin molybdotransferase